MYLGFGVWDKFSRKKRRWQILSRVLTSFTSNSKYLYTHPKASFSFIFYSIEIGKIEKMEKEIHLTISLLLSICLPLVPLFLRLLFHFQMSYLERSKRNSFIRELFENFCITPKLYNKIFQLFA